MNNDFLARNTSAVYSFFMEVDIHDSIPISKACSVGSLLTGRAFGTRPPSHRPFRSKGLPRRLKQMPQSLAQLFRNFLLSDNVPCLYTLYLLIGIAAVDHCNGHVPDRLVIESQRGSLQIDL